MFVQVPCTRNGVFSVLSQCINSCAIFLLKYLSNFSDLGLYFLVSEPLNYKSWKLFWCCLLEVRMKVFLVCIRMSASFEGFLSDCQMKWEQINHLSPVVFDTASFISYRFSLKCLFLIHDEHLHLGNSIFFFF